MTDKAFLYAVLDLPLARKHRLLAHQAGVAFQDSAVMHVDASRCLDVARMLMASGGIWHLTLMPGTPGDYDQWDWTKGDRA